MGISDHAHLLGDHLFFFLQSSEFTLSRKCEVTKTENILQIPVTNPQPCLIGLKFHNKDDEMQFLLKVGEQIRELIEAISQAYLTVT